MVHGQFLSRYDDFRRRRSISKRTVRPDGVVVDAPLLDDHLCFSQRVEDLSVEQFIAQLAVEGFGVDPLHLYAGNPADAKQPGPIDP
jgi:hypothetical protein